MSNKTKIHIPLPEDDAVRALLRVKPTKEMPRPGSQTVGQRKQHWIKNGNVAACGAVVAESPKQKRSSKITCRSCLALLARAELLKEQESTRNRKR